MDAAMDPRFAQAAPPDAPRAPRRPAGGGARAAAPASFTEVAGPFRDADASDDDRQFALFTHLASLLTVVSIGIPVLGLIATIVMWRIGKDRSPFVDDHGRQAVNFQISMYVIYAILVAIGVTLTVVTFGVLSFVFALTPLVLVAMTVIHIIAVIRGMMAANRGEYYRYPICFSFLG